MEPINTGSTMGSLIYFIAFLMLMLIVIAAFTIEGGDDVEEVKETEEQKELREFSESINKLDLSSVEKRKIIKAWKKKKEEEHQEYLAELEERRRERRIVEQSSRDSYDDSRRYNYREQENESVEYVPQRLGGSGWLTLGPGFSNLDSAISSLEYSMRYHPKDRFRVAEKRNGRIVGTAYSC